MGLGGQRPELYKINCDYWYLVISSSSPNKPFDTRRMEIHLENHIMTSHPSGFTMTGLNTGQSYLLRRSAIYVDFVGVEA